MNRTLFAGLFATCLSLALGAADAPAQSMEEKRDAKLAEKWIKDGGWVTDYDVARQKAKEQGKHIFTYFSRSYAP